jgi:hypothetical protein
MFSQHERARITLCNIKDMFVGTMLLMKMETHKLYESGVNCDIISGNRGAYLLSAYISNYKEQSHS